jgi:hypothetical protein
MNREKTQINNQKQKMGDNKHEENPGNHQILLW